MPLTGIEIRQIRSGDEEALTDFYNNLGKEAKRVFKPFGPSVTIQRCRKVIKDNEMAVGKKCDYVAFSKGRMVAWCFLWSLQSQAPTFGLAVAEDFQGRHLGSRMMDLILQIAAKKGAEKVSLTVVKDNKRALRMYERKGFVHREMFIGTDRLDYIYMTLDFTDKTTQPPKTI